MHCVETVETKLSETRWTQCLHQSLQRGTFSQRLNVGVRSPRARLFLFDSHKNHSLWANLGHMKNWSEPRAIMKTQRWNKTNFRCIWGYLCRCSPTRNDWTRSKLEQQFSIFVNKEAALLPFWFDELLSSTFSAFLKLTVQFCFNICKKSQIFSLFSSCPVCRHV